MHFSDGSAAQYKKRTKFINICHEQDFGLSAEWHFFATSHGKGPVDSKKASCKSKSTETVQKSNSNTS
jgi:hypothetical protein